MSSKLKNNETTKTMPKGKIPVSRRALIKTRPTMKQTEIATKFGVSVAYINLILHNKRHLNPSNPKHRSIAIYLNNL